MTRADDDALTQQETETGGPAWLGGPRVVVLGKSGAQYVALPERGQLVIGRDPDADVRIEHPRVSRRHALIHAGDPPLVEDLGSVNGTRIDGVAIEPHRPRPMPPGTAVSIGGSFLIVEDPRGLRAAAFPPANAGSDDADVPGAAMNELRRLLQRVARSTIAVVLYGETGVGKEIFAEQLHAASPRAAAPFVRLNCAALPESLLESELFGYERGAFTGAVQSKPGLLEWGHKGTIFLDEIGEMPPSTQVKLLRVLENRELTRIGGLKPRPIDVRIVSATHRDLAELAKTGEFRQDLYFRLNGITIFVPPLRDRQSEIVPLAQRFLEQGAAAMGEPVPSLSPAAAQKLEEYAWPGNVRELKNAAERAIVLAAGAPLMPEHFALGSMVHPSGCAPPPTGPPPAGGVELRDEVVALERRRIIEALERSGGNQTEAARDLNMPRRTLISRLDHYGIARPRKRTPRRR